MSGTIPDAWISIKMSGFRLQQMCKLLIVIASQHFQSNLSVLRFSASMRVSVSRSIPELSSVTGLLS